MCSTHSRSILTERDAQWNWSPHVAYCGAGLSPVAVASGRRRTAACKHPACKSSRRARQSRSTSRSKSKSTCCCDHILTLIGNLSACPSAQLTIEMRESEIGAPHNEHGRSAGQGDPHHRRSLFYRLQPSGRRNSRTPRMQDMKAAPGRRTPRLVYLMPNSCKMLAAPSTSAMFHSMYRLSTWIDRVFTLSNRKFDATDS